MGKKSNDAMKKQLLETVEGLREDGVDLAETPALFTWGYDEEPWIEFQLLITETERSSLIDQEEENVH